MNITYNNKLNKNLNDDEINKEDMYRCIIMVLIGIVIF